MFPFIYYCRNCKEPNTSSLYQIWCKTIFRYCYLFVKEICNGPALSDHVKRRLLNFNSSDNIFNLKLTVKEIFKICVSPRRKFPRLSGDLLLPLILDHLESLRLPFDERKSFLESVLQVQSLQDLQLLFVGRVHQRREEIGQLVTWNCCQHSLYFKIRSFRAGH